MSKAAPAPAEESEHLGVLASLKATPGTARFVLLGVFINQFGAFLQMFMVLYLVHRGFSAELAGFALGAYGAGAVVGMFSGGGMSDRLGPRLTIAISMGTAAVMVVSVSFLSYYPAILAVVALAGAMAQANRPASAALLTSLTPPSRHVMVMSMNRLAISSGTVAGPLVGAWVITFSWDLLLWLDGLGAMSYALIALFLLPAKTKSAKSESDQDEPPKVSYLTVLKDVKFLLFLGAMLTNAMVYIQYFTVLPLSLKDAGYPTVYYSAVFALSAGIVMTCELWVTTYVQKWRAWIAASLGLLLLGLGLVGFGLPGGAVMIFSATVVGAIGQMIGGPTIFAWPVKVAPEAAKGRYLGAALAMFSLGNAAGPVLGVLAYDAIGGLIWWLCGGCAILSALAAAVAMRQPQQAPQPEPVAEPQTETAGASANQGAS